ncbi:hypothetical protein BIY21_05290 [Vibrio ponticus]|uniref:DUF4402 domain-containing protein n=1 Tax=Vibrio ponticus TaxID=265668 RepID=A0ABX3F3C6_9VIBR|nr:DUF4402 domain-containing protein [Vibrio ponticus]OLQ84303.1 hypothetical protein BIY21_05290 [Vibrio ponticus]
MKNLVKVVAASAIALSTSNVIASNTASTTFNASIQVVQALEIAKTQDLTFPKVYSTQTGKVTVNAADATAAVFTVTGEENNIVDVEVANTNVTNGSDSYALSFLTDPTLTISGDTELRIGGEVDFLNNGPIPSGTYTANAINVKVTYQ